MKSHRCIRYSEVLNQGRIGFYYLQKHKQIAHGTVVLCLFSKLTGKEENFSTQQVPKNDVFLMSFFGLSNYAFQSGVLKASDLHPVSFSMGITKPCTHPHPAPSTSTQLISTFTQLHSPPPSSFQPPLSSLQHPQQYLNQNITRNWAISQNLGQKIKSCPFWLKIGLYGTLEGLILNPDLDFWNSGPKIHFWANLGRKT